MVFDRSYCTNIVFILLYSQLDHVLGLLQDVHGVLHGAVLQAHAVDGQQPVARLESACSTGQHNKRIITINGKRPPSPDSVRESY